MMFPLRKPNLA